MQDVPLAVHGQEKRSDAACPEPVLFVPWDTKRAIHNTEEDKDIQLVLSSGECSKRDSIKTSCTQLVLYFNWIIGSFTSTLKGLCAFANSTITWVSSKPALTYISITCYEQAQRCTFIQTSFPTFLLCFKHNSGSVFTLPAETRQLL